MKTHHKQQRTMRSKGMSSRIVQKNVDRSQYGHEEALLENRGGENSPDWMDTLRSLRSNIRSCKANKKRSIRAWERQVEVNVFIVQILSNL